MIGGRVSSGRWLARLTAFTLVAIVVAAAFGWRAGRAPSLHAALAAPVAWALPPAKSGDLERDAGILQARRPWGGQGAFSDTDTPLPAPAQVVVPWRLVGIVLRQDERFALIQFGQGPGGGQFEYRTIGDKLPDGSALVEVENDSVTTQGEQGSPSGRIIHRLFAKRP